MALSVKPSRISTVFALVATDVIAVSARSLNQPNPLDHLPGVVQFDMPRDIKFVLCGGEDCPGYSIRHLYVPPPPPPAVQEPVMPAPQSTQPPEELSHAKVSAKKEPLKKERREPMIQYGRRPVGKPK